MVEISPEDEVQKMLSIIYQIPIGLVEADKAGNITQMNAKSVQLLMPLFFSMQLTGENINELLEKKAPDLLFKTNQFTEETGNIVNQVRQEILFADQHGRQIVHQYSFTINKLSADNLMYMIEDITDSYEKEKTLNQILQDKAIEQNKFEIAAAVLHDIGNAIVGFGSYITKIKRLIEQNDLGTIESLKGFIEKNLPALNNAIGETKAKALLDLLAGFIAGQNSKLKDIKGSLTDQMKIIGHIQEILNIQRQYVKGDSMEREPVNIRSVVNDTVAMIFGNLDKNSITFNFDAPSVLPKLKGDRTKLMQVFLNLFKNAIDGVTSNGNINKEINASIIADNTTIIIKIKDNGIGFTAETSEQLFNRGYTTKTEGTGLGLINCKGIIEAHNGEITLTSAGIGMGATATIIFNL